MKKLFLKFKNLIKLFFAKRNRIYYINGPETLPPPLSKEEEAEILESGEITAEGRDKLVEHNLRLVVYIAKRFENTNINIEDLVSIGTIGLIKAINTFCPDKNIKLATYASRCIENEILMFIRKNTQTRTELSIDEPLSVDWDGNELLLSDILCSDSDSVFCDIETEEDRRIIKGALGELTERERIIISLRFGLNGASEKTQKEVADMLGISQSYISRLEKRIIAELKQKLEAKY